MIKIAREINEGKKMLNKLSIYLLIIFEIIMGLSHLTYGRLKIADFRWTKTECFPSYGRWTNQYNDAIFQDFVVSPYFPEVSCWVRGDKIRFLQPFFDTVIILEIYAILLLFRIIAKRI